MQETERQKSSRNKTLGVSDEERRELEQKLIAGVAGGIGQGTDSLLDGGGIIHGDCLGVLRELPPCFVDLLIADPPYNLRKTYSGTQFKRQDGNDYQDWLQSWITLLPRILKPNATVYICCDWSCSALVYAVASRYFRVVNRITWEREKGRAALKNWKNCSEDIWYFSKGAQPKFNTDAVKLKRRVVAPYKSNGLPKGWQTTSEGNFRFTAASNLWTDISVPFWSMAENTDHPTQKPEKLLAKLILASSDAGDMICDPFLGSGTTAVVAKKLGRRFLGIEQEKEYCLLAQKRLDLADTDTRIQGYIDGVFLERNTMQLQAAQSKK